LLADVHGFNIDWSTWNQCPMPNAISLGKWESLPSMAAPRSNLAATECCGSLFVVGGTTGHGNIVSTVEQFNFHSTWDGGRWASGSWQEMKGLLMSRMDFGLVSCQHLLFALGGLNMTGPLDTVEFFNPDFSEEGWQQIDARLTVPRFCLSVASCEGKIYATGGMDGSNMILNSVDMFEPLKTEQDRRRPPTVTSKAFPMPPLPCRLSHHSLVVRSRKSFMWSEFKRMYSNRKGTMKVEDLKDALRICLIEYAKKRQFTEQDAMDLLAAVWDHAADEDDEDYPFDPNCLAVRIWTSDKKLSIDGRPLMGKEVCAIINDLIRSDEDGPGLSNVLTVTRAINGLVMVRNPVGGGRVLSADKLPEKTDDFGNNRPNVLGLQFSEGCCSHVLQL